MSPRPKRTKPDKNQRQIIDELEALGFDVDRICDLPGLYDLIVSGYKRVAIRGHSDVVWVDKVPCAVRVEIKSEKGKLNESEKEYWDAQKHDNLIIARQTSDVLKWFGRE